MSRTGLDEPASMEMKGLPLVTWLDTEQQAPEYVGPEGVRRSMDLVACGDVEANERHSFDSPLTISCGQ